METNKANQEFQSDFLSVTDARQAIADLIASSYESSGMHLKKEVLPLHQCLGRILAGDILSPIDVPAHDFGAIQTFLSALDPGASKFSIQFLFGCYNSYMYFLSNSHNKNIYH